MKRSRILLLDERLRRSLFFIFWLNQDGLLGIRAAYFVL